jgi:hypothetical protein
VGAMEKRWVASGNAHVVCSTHQVALFPSIAPADAMRATAQGIVASPCDSEPAYAETRRMV